MAEKKKILLLGGSAQQVIAIEKAKELGYETVLCDYLPDNPGQYHADKFYQTSTTDKEAILRVAEQEKIHGIIAYASDPAAPTAAYVAEKMGLPTNPWESVEILCNKDRFRSFLRSSGFNAPVSQGYEDARLALSQTSLYRLPVIVKPVDSSGSKGVTVLRDWDGFEEALAFAFSFSRSHRVIVEEYIEKAHPYLIGGDIFVIDGQIRLWGLLNCHRDARVNSLVPVGKSYPLDLSAEAEAAVRQTLQEMVDKLRIRQGAMNVELVVDAAGRVWPIDVGPRNGGNMIPDLLGYIFDVDVVEMSICAAMGRPITSQIQEGKPCFATHNLHSHKSGILKEIRFSADLERYIIRKNIYKQAADTVEFFDNAAKALGIVFFHFDDRETMRRYLTNINDYIDIVLEA